MLVFEYELLLIQLIGTVVSVAMETMNICIINMHFCRIYGFFSHFYIKEVPLTIMLQ